MTISAWSDRTLSGLRDRLSRPRLRKPADAFSWALEDDTRPASQSLPQLADAEKLRFTGTALVAIGAVLLGFALQFAFVSQISYIRDQQLALSDYRYQLANATAPVGQTGQDGKLLPAGTAVAVLAAPSIGLRDVVFEGTTSADTKSGPGHRRDTPLPGQAGSSVVYGRQAAYGAPFGSISKLKLGDTITATTGQGVAKYTVTDVRYTGDPVPAALQAGQGRLTLVSGAGFPFLPQTVVRVDATLAGTVQPTPDRVLSYAAIADDELAMAGDGSAWPLLVLALIMLVLVTILVTVSRKFWGSWQTWIVALPLMTAIGLFAAQQLATLLPNVM